MRVLTPGFGQTMPSRAEIEREFEVFLDEMPVFRFTDTASGAPVERVRLLLRALDLDWPRWSGEFPAPGGLLALPAGLSFLARERSAYELLAWSADHAPSVLTLQGLDELGARFGVM